MNSQTIKYLFVYGSLRPGFRQIHTIPGAAAIRRTLRLRAHHLGTASVAGQLIDLGNYPGWLPASETSSSGRVVGDLYQLRDKTLIKHMDAYEGCAPGDPQPHEYRRVLTTATLTCATDVRQFDTWIYEYLPSARRAHPISGNDWLSYLAGFKTTFNGKA